MPTMKFTVEIDLDPILDDTQNEHANLPLPELEETIKDSLTIALAEIENNYGASIELKNDQGEIVYL